MITDAVHDNNHDDDDEKTENDPTSRSSMCENIKEAASCCHCMCGCLQLILCLCCINSS